MFEALCVYMDKEYHVKEKNHKKDHSVLHNLFESQLLTKFYRFTYRAVYNCGY